MNDRIKELMVKASSGACYDNPAVNELKGSEIIRFAELLIQECCLEIAEEAARHSQYGMGVLAVSSNSIAKIKQRFGINGL